MIHPSLLERKIIHFDMDAFYASIEEHDDASLRGKPVVVGGSPQSRAVVCTANYEARKYGIRSAMPCSHAYRLCPQAIFIKPNFEKYRDISKKIRKIFLKYTPKIEPLSLDEAYLDVTDNQFNLLATKIAKMIQDEIFEDLQLTGSAGVAPNKLLAKIASDLRKPRGLTVILPEQAQSFIGNLALRVISGVGPVMERHLAAAGLKLCSDVWPLSLGELEEKIGNRAQWIYNSSRGIDTRPVESRHIRKSLGHERTFSKDLLDIKDLQMELIPLTSGLVSELENKGLKGRSITLKVKYSDFSRITRSHTIENLTSDLDHIRDICAQLLLATDAGRRKIRLLGVSIANFS